MSVVFEGRSHIGKVRKNNEDNYLCLALGTPDEHQDVRSEQCLLLVADGVGGRAHGEIASQICVDTFTELVATGKFPATDDVSMREMLLRMGVQKAHVRVSEMAQENSEYTGMSCTLTLVIACDKTVSFAQVGDSRLYLYANSELEQISKDQTVAQVLVEEGRLNQDEIAHHPDRNTLSQSMGLEAVGSPLEPEIKTVNWDTGARIILCSDGLTDMVSDAQIEDIVATSPDCPMTANELIQLALDGGGKDNVTVVVAERQQEK